MAFINNNLRQKNIVKAIYRLIYNKIENYRNLHITNYYKELQGITKNCYTSVKKAFIGKNTLNFSNNPKRQQNTVQLKFPHVSEYICQIWCRIEKYIQENGKYQFAFA